MKKRALLLLTCGFLLAPCKSTLAQDISSDYQDVLKLLDRKGGFKASVLKVNIPRNDLKITIQGFSTPTPFGFGGWIAFTRTTDSTNVAGLLLFKR